MKELFEKKIIWTNEEIENIKYNFFSYILNLKTKTTIEIAIGFAQYLNNCSINNNNYPIFLKFLDFKNNHVINALIGSQDPFTFMNSIQPNYFIISTCFEFLNKYQINHINKKLLGVILGYLKYAYDIPMNGYKIYPPTIFDINHLSKYLNKENDNNDIYNKTILNILDKISSLESQCNDEKIETLAIYAHNIRNTFFDVIKKLEEILPSILFKNESNYISEVHPRKLVLLSQLENKEQNILNLNNKKKNNNFNILNK